MKKFLYTFANPLSYHYVHYWLNPLLTKPLCLKLIESVSTLFIYYLKYHVNLEKYFKLATTLQNNFNFIGV